VATSALVVDHDLGLGVDPDGIVHEHERGS
jgi:hypothetical protein